MRATDAYGASIKGSRVLTSSRGALSVRPGVGSWVTLLLSLLFVGISTVTWKLDEQTMVWLLSHDLVHESATRTLPDTLRRASLVMAGMGALAALPMAAWSVHTVYRWGPVRTLEAHLWTALKMLLSPLWRPAHAVWVGVSTVVGYARSAIALTLLNVWRSVTIVARVSVQALRIVALKLIAGLGYVWVTIATVLGYVKTGGIAVLAVVDRTLRYAGIGVAVVARATGTALAYVWVAIATVLGYVWTGVAIFTRAVGVALRYTGLGAGIVARATGIVLAHVWLAIATVLGYVKTGGIAVLAVVDRTLRFAGIGVAVVARATGIALAHVWLAVATVLAYVWRGGAIATGDMGTAVSKVFGYLDLAGIAMGRVIGLALRGLSRVASSGVRLAMVGVVLAERYVLSVAIGIGWAVEVVVGALWRVASALIGYGTTTVSRPYGYTHMVGLVVGREVALGLGVVLRGVVRVIGYVVGAASKVLDYGWKAALAGARFVGVPLGLLLSAIYTALAQTVVRVIGYVVGAASKVLDYGWKAALAGARFVGVPLGLLLSAIYTALTQTVVRVIGYVVGAASKVLDYGWKAALAGVRFVGVPLGLLLSAIYTALTQTVVRVIGYVVGAASKVLDYGWKAALAGVRFVGVPLGLLLSTIYTALAHTVVRVIGYVVGAASKVLDYGWKAALAGARFVGVPLRLLLSAIYTALAQTVALALVAGTAARGAFQVLHYGWTVIATASRFAWQGGRALLELLWTGVKVVIYHAALAVATASQGAVRVMGHTSAVLAATAVFVWSGIRVLLHYLAIVASAMVRPLGWPLGRPTVWTMGQLGRGMYLISLGLVRSPLVAARTAGAAVAVTPDVLKVGLWLLTNRKGVSAMPDNQVKREGLVSLVVTVLVLFAVSAVAVRIFWPPPPEPTVVVAHWTTGHLTRDGLLKDMAEEFNKAGHRIGSGTRIVVEVYDAPSELQGKYLSELLINRRRLDLNKITNGCVVKSIPDPTIVTPSSAHWLVTVNHEVGRSVVDLDTAESIVRPVIRIVTYEEMARCLGWPQKQIGFADIIALKNDPLGWRSYPDCASGEWGPTPLLAFTDPTTSSTGRSLHLALYSIAANKRPQDLTINDVNDPEVEAYLKEFQGLIDHYLIGTTVLNTKIYQGPRYGHFFIMPEDNLIHLYEGTEKSFMNGIKTTAPAIEERMVMIYPKEGSMPRNNCACIVQAEWVSEEQVEASQQWIEFIREDEQQRTFMAAGFRPGTDLDLNYPGSKISSKFGLNPDEPKVVLNPSRTLPEVAAAIDSNWEQVKRPGIVTFVVDTSGSMMGTKLSQARDGLNRALETMAQNNQVGFLSFDDTIHNIIPVGPLENNKWDVQDAVHEMRARGETALYEAIKAAIEMTADAPGEEDAIRAVVVLTDGLANICQTQLDHIIAMESRNEASILSFSGCQDSPPAHDKYGRSVNTEDLIGTGLAIDVRNPVQVFFIGIGEAHLNIGRLLAEATGAEYQGVTEEDLANVLEEFSRYF